MTNLILTLIVCSTVITTVINFSKPAYEGLVKKKYASTISIGFAFALGIVAAFSLDWGIASTVGAKILLGLALGTGSTIWYDARGILKALGTRLSGTKD